MRCQMVAPPPGVAMTSKACTWRSTDRAQEAPGGGRARAGLVGVDYLPVHDGVAQRTTSVIYDRSRDQ
jgi:hypothetical protein